MPARTGILIGVAVVTIGLTTREVGRLETPRVRIVSPVPGAVLAVYVGVDANVKAGQELALIDSPALRARVETAKADLEMERSAVINAENAAEDPEAQFALEAEAKVDLAKADLQRCELAAEAAETALKQQAVLSPIDGRVTAVKAQIGQSVAPGKKGAILFEMAPKDAM